MKNIGSLNPAISIIVGDLNENVESGILLLLVTILERNLISLYLSRGILKLLTNLAILQTIHLPALTLFLHLFLT